MRGSEMHTLRVNMHTLSPGKSNRKDIPFLGWSPRKNMAFRPFFFFPQSKK